MRAVLASFTGNGCDLAETVRGILVREEVKAEHYTTKRNEREGVTAFPKPFKEWCGDVFDTSDLLIFVGATGIAVRGIAPYIKGKDTDPAVLVIDEKGTFVISLLSGHLGGANRWAAFLANALKATPVITTATDVNNRFAVDVFSKDNGLTVAEVPRIKWVSGAVLREEPVGFLVDLPEGFTVSFAGEVPEGIVITDHEHAGEFSTGILVTTDTKKELFERTLHLLPSVVLGVGCKKNTPVERIRERVLGTLKEKGIDPKAVKTVASIDLKAEEPGLLAFCREQNVNFETFSAEELREVSGNFTPSSFVSSITGVDNVCERSAVKASEGELIFGKNAAEGVTVAAAMKREAVLQF